MKSKIAMMGIPIDNISFSAFMAQCRESLIKKQKKVIYTPNPEILMAAQKNPALKRALLRADYCTADGIGLIYGAKIKKKPLVERVRGYDVSIALLEIANEMGYKVYFLGAQEEKVKKAAVAVKEKYPNLQLVGAQHGYFKGFHNGHPGHEEEKQVLSDIVATGPQMLFVGFGAPKQELWVDQYQALLPPAIIIGNGGTIDILSGEVKLAPAWMRRVGLEWFYRLMKHPTRIKRQMVLPRFMLHIIFGGKDVVQTMDEKKEEQNIEQ